jgi:hypothetical protein
MLNVVELSNRRQARDRHVVQMLLTLKARLQAVSDDLTQTLSAVEQLNKKTDADIGETAVRIADLQA